MLPAVSEDGERKSGQGLSQVIGPIHDKLHAGSDHAELADNQLVARKIKVVLDVFLEVVNVFKIVIVGIITDDNVGVFDYVFEETEAVVVWEGEFGVFVGSGHFVVVRLLQILLNISHHLAD